MRMDQVDPWNFGLTLQRYLRLGQPFLFRMRAVGTVIPHLDPFNDDEEFLNAKSPQGQRGL